MSKTEENLKKAFIEECQAYMRYTFFGEMADEMGYPEIANMFRTIARGEESHARGHLFFLAKLGAVEIKNVKDALKAAIDKEMDETKNMYPRMVKEAKEEGYKEIANWLETTGKAESKHLRICRKLLKSLK